MPDEPISGDVSSDDCIAKLKSELALRKTLLTIVSSLSNESERANKRVRERLMKIIDIAMSGINSGQLDSHYCEVCKIHTFSEHEELSECLCSAP